MVDRIEIEGGRDRDRYHYRGRGRGRNGGRGWNRESRDDDDDDDDIDSVRSSRADPIPPPTSSPRNTQPLPIQTSGPNRPFSVLPPYVNR